MTIKFNIGYEITADTTTAARAAAGFVSKWPLTVRRFQCVGLGNAIVGQVLRMQPGDASSRPNQLRSCAVAFGNPADANRKQACSALAKALDEASDALMGIADEEKMEKSMKSLEDAFNNVAKAFDITVETPNGNRFLAVADMPEPEDRRGTRDGDDNDAADPFNTPIMKRGKRRAE